MVSGPSFFIDGPSKDEIDDAISLARAWAVQVDTPASLVENDDYSSKQWALWSQQYAATVATGNHVLDSHTDVVLTTPALNQVLTYNGTNWVNQDLSAISTIDAANVTFTPSTLADWTGSVDPGDADVALDQLADRLSSVETVSSSWPSAFADPVDWNGDVLPDSIGRAIDQLADRVNGLETLHPESIIIACSDETTALSVGVAKVTFRMPYAMTVLSVSASLSTAQTSGASLITVDINDSGSSILSTKLTIDNGEKTSLTAATPAVISASSLAADDEITIDIDAIGDGTAKGLKVIINGTRA
jgi:hypothetical protein